MKKIGIFLGISLIALSLTSCKSMFGGTEEASPQYPAAKMPEHSMPMSMEMRDQPHNYASTLPPSPMPQPQNQMQVGYQQGAPLPMPASSGSSLAAASFGGMSAADHNRLSHGLDATPGKSTHWTNVSTGVSYTVTPTKKVVVNNNHLCREYQTVAEHNGQRQVMTGTACITDDGNWHSVQ